MDQKETMFTITDPTATSIGKVLREMRQDAGVTQQELEKRTGITQTEISRYELGKRNITLRTLLRLTEALGFHLSIRYLPKEDQLL